VRLETPSGYAPTASAWPEPDGARVHLLSLVDHATGTTAAQHEIAAKTNEIPELAALLDRTDIAGKVLTLDAPHTQRDTARLIIERHNGHHLMTVKANQCAARRFDASPPEAGQTGQDRRDSSRSVRAQRSWRMSSFSPAARQFG
jgi:hypothetical protein